ncbi:MAG: glycosyl hydrolase [Candidatus Aminicenantes bacterium]
MIKKRRDPGVIGTALAAALLIAAACAACAKKPSADTYESILRAFTDPPVEFRSAPLWVWNDLMTREEIARQLEGFKERGIGGAFIHPRPGLITPYLTDEWFSLCAYAVETGKSLGLRIWLYDENSYPSGFAGGHVPAQMPDAVRSGLRMSRVQGPLGGFDEQPLVVLRKTLTGFEDVTAKPRPGGNDQSVYHVFEVVRSQPSPWHGGFAYVDLMRKDVTERFLDLTLNGYKRVVGKEFGLTVPGVFQDEAEISPAGGREAVSYTPALFQAFQAKWAYDLRPHLVSLFEEVGDWRRVRHNYYATLLDLFIENWAKPYYAYAADNNLVFTGHYWEHEWPSPRVSPDNLAMAAYAHMPGIDMLMNEWSEGPHAQFGNARAVREIRSVANQLGRRRTLSETYGAGGWDLTFFDQKRIGDWQYALGVNFLNQHLSYATIKGARKRDHPPSFSDHQPWWGSYNTLADYFARLSVVMSMGEQVNRILVIEPTTSAWMHTSPASRSQTFETIASDFQNFVHLLEAEHIEYDLVSEKTLQEFGSARYGQLRVGGRGYDMVILPPGIKSLNDGTVVLLRDFLMRKGKIISWPAPPDYVNGILTDDLRVLQNSYGDRWLDSGPGSGFDKVRAYAPPAVVFSEPAAHRRLFHHRREYDGGRFVFLANASPDEAADGRMSLEGGSAEVWDPFTGGVRPYPYERHGDTIEVRFSVPPGGSLLLCVPDHRGRPEPVGAPVDWEEVPAEGEMVVEADSPNVLTLDYCDLVLGGRRERDLYFYDAQRKTFQFHGLERNPWDSAVQYKTNILDLDTFPPGSGFEAVFGFRAVKGDALDFSDLRAVVERPELFRVSVNGREVKPTAGEWWLDRAFGVYPIGPLVVSGRNTLTVAAKPFTIHSELEPVYLLGDFRLRPASRGFEVLPPSPMTAGSWAAQGLPHYASSVRYRRTFVVSEAEAGASYRLRIGPWRGATAEAFVGGRRIGTAAFAPHTVDLTGSLAAGLNEITVVVTGTLKNTLGPFHNDPPLGKAWPGSFQQGAKGGPPAGAAYHVVDYGLFEEFKLFRGAGK